ncbi:unnamed protein product, partial [Sphacelaria rigidula]
AVVVRNLVATDESVATGSFEDISCSQNVPAACAIVQEMASIDHIGDSTCTKCVDGDTGGVTSSSSLSPSGTDTTSREIVPGNSTTSSSASETDLGNATTSSMTPETEVSNSTTSSMTPETEVSNSTTSSMTPETEVNNSTTSSMTPETGVSDSTTSSMTPETEVSNSTTSSSASESGSEIAAGNGTTTSLTSSSSTLNPVGTGCGSSVDTCENLKIAIEGVEGACEVFLAGDVECAESITVGAGQAVAVNGKANGTATNYGISVGPEFTMADSEEEADGASMFVVDSGG